MQKCQDQKQSQPRKLPEKFQPAPVHTVHVINIREIIVECGGETAESDSPKENTEEKSTGAGMRFERILDREHIVHPVLLKK